MKINVYMDDMRPGPSFTAYDDWQDWVIVRSIDNTKKLLENDLVYELSLDHDMGSELTGYDLTKWMAEHNIWPKSTIHFHTANPVGMKNMKDTVDRYAPDRCKE